MLHSYLNNVFIHECISVAMWQEGTVQPTMTYTDLPSGVEMCRRAVHVLTHTHIYINTNTRNLCQLLTCTGSSGPSIDQSADTVLSQIIYFQSTRFLTRSRLFVCPWWKAMVSSWDSIVIYFYDARTVAAEWGRNNKSEVVLLISLTGENTLIHFSSSKSLISLLHNAKIVQIHPQTSLS